jgi:hypothetical protein
MIEIRKNEESPGYWVGKHNGIYSKNELSIKTLGITTLSIMTLGITALSIKTLSIMTFNVTQLSITINKTQHKA